MAPRPLHIVTGKGGVGKTTIALGLAAALARDGARVLVCEVESRNGLASATRRSVSGSPSPLFGAGSGSVLGAALDARAALESYLDRYLRLGFAAGLLQLNPLVEFATAIAPGLRDILLIGQVTHLAKTAAGVDAVVLDAPPAGRIAGFLGAGAALSALAESGPIADQARSVATDLRSDSCRVHLVTTLAELPVTEAIETASALRAMDLNLDGVIANQVPSPPATLPAVVPPAPGVGAPAWAAMLADLAADRALAEAAEGWRRVAADGTGLTVTGVAELPRPLGIASFAGIAAQLDGVVR